jgi:SnoaL-like domain
MPAPQDIVERYLAAFNETEPQRRRGLLQALYDSDSTYTDPHVDLCGPGEIDAFIAATRDRFPGFVFSLAGPVDAHHDQMRFQWQAGPPEEAHPPYLGFDVIVTRNGKIRSVHGFTDAAPSA